MAAEKRLSNEFADTIGCAPATRLGAGKADAGPGVGAAAAVSVTAGFKGGRGAAACLVSAFGAEAFDIAGSGRGSLASAAFGLAVAD